MQNIVNKDIDMQTAVLIFIAMTCILFIIYHIQNIRTEYLRVHANPKHPLYIRILSFISLLFICAVIDIISSLALSIGYTLCINAGIPIKEATSIINLLLRSIVSSIGVILILANLIVIILTITILIIGIKQYFITPEPKDEEENDI